MPLVPFGELMADAEAHNYAVGYFESWNLESLQAVADAAESTRSPVILGFSGIYLPHPDRVAREKLDWYAALGLTACRGLSVPSCFLFNESPNLDWVWQSIDLGFNLVMFSDEELELEEQTLRVSEVVGRARRAGVAVEAEMTSPPGLSGDLLGVPQDLHLTDPAAAGAFVERTGVDALAVNVGQVHLHGRDKVRLDLERLGELRRAVAVPLVLHGATSVQRQDLAGAGAAGIRKINVGSVLKRSYLEAIRSACAQLGYSYNPYDVVGSGFSGDVLVAGRIAVQAVVEDLMRLFGCAGRA